MKRTMFALIAAAAMAGSATAADTDTSRSVGSHPVVYDDYPESDVVIDVGPDIVLTVTGEARTRFEWIENTTDFSDDGFAGDGDKEEFDDSISYTPARFNIGFRADLPRDVAAVIELQGNFELGGGPAGAGTELRAQTTQHQRPGVINGEFRSFSRVGGGAGAIGVSPEPQQLEIVRVLNDLDGDGVFVYQGFIETAHIGDSIFSMRFGRQELAYGTEFLLGNQDFYDGQTFDGIKGIFEFTENHRLDLFWAKLAERDTTLSGGATPFLNQGGDDSDLFGAYFSAQSLGGSSIGMDAYVIGIRDDANLELDVTLDRDEDNDGIDGDISFNSGLDIDAGRSYLEAWWTGVRFFREREHGFHFSAELTYLFGSLDSDFTDTETGDTRNDIDINAWAFEGFWGYTWNTPTNPSFHGNVTYATGSDFDDYEDGDYATFFTPAGEVHPRLGMMDLIDASNIMALSLGYSGSINCHSWGVDLWHFEQVEVDPEIDANTVDGTALELNRGLDEELGQEIDLWYNYQYSEHMLAQFAISYFNAGDFIEESNRCADDFGGCDPGADVTDGIVTDDAWRVYANLLVRF